MTPPLNSPGARLLRRPDGYVALLALLWLGMALPFLLLGVLELSKIESDTEALAKERGQALFRLIELTREWNARHGGIYVPVSENSQPNPYLVHPRRDLVADDGGALTMVNPAFMTRQIAELAAERTGVQFRITSHRPIRPDNLADSWEGDSLQRFERGEMAERIQFFAQYRIGGEARAVHRYIAPLYVTPACLACHAVQGFKVGDIRGGISVTMPAEVLLAHRDKRQRESALILLVCYLLTAGVLHAFVARIRRHYLVLEELARRQEAVIVERTRELKLLNEDLRRKAHHDPLTMLPNRLLFNDRLDSALIHARRYGRSFALLLVDLDFFKEVNDAFGHAAGDELLVDVARRLETCVRESDTVARLGGDEFAILLSETGDAAEAENVARRTVELLGEPYLLSAGMARVSASVGMALYPAHGDSAEALLRNADVALYSVKLGGRNGWRVYAPVMAEGTRG